MVTCDLQFIIYKRVDERTGNGEERLKIIVDGEEIFEHQAAALIREYEEAQETEGAETAGGRKTKRDPELQGKTRERMLAELCVEQGFYRGRENGSYDYNTISDPGWKTRPIINKKTGVRDFKIYRDDAVSGDTIARFIKALETVYQERRKNNPEETG